MKIKSVKLLYFSPASTTKTIVNEIAKHFAMEKDVCDLLKQPIEEEWAIDSDSLVIVGMPVYAGRIPALCAKMLANLKGKRSPAIVVAVYGNREYDDALLELKNIMEAANFIVLGAGSFVARHSIFPAVAGTRPDESDREMIARFSGRCAELLHANAFENSSIVVNGNFPYQKAKNIPLKPSANKKCNRCGACVTVCPANAIPEAAPNQTDKSSCISCTACIHVCPQQARAFQGFLYKIAGKIFARKNAVRKEPDMFFMTTSKGPQEA